MKVKRALSLLMVLAAAGSVWAAEAVEPAQSGGLLVKIFLVFIGAVIAVQLLPGLVLLGSMIKGVFSKAEKGQIGR